MCIFGRLLHPFPRCHLFNVSWVSGLVLISVRIPNLLHPLPFCSLSSLSWEFRPSSLLPSPLFSPLSCVIFSIFCASSSFTRAFRRSLQNNADAIGNLILRWLKAALLSANPFRSRIQLSSLKSRLPERAFFFAFHKLKDIPAYARDASALHESWGRCSQVLYHVENIVKAWISCYK